MTISSTQIFGLVTIVGGVVVLGSYGYGIMAFPKLRQGLWGGIHGRWRLVFTLSMFLAAVGYLVFSHFMLFRGGLESFEDGILALKTLPHLVTIFFLLSSSIWMPATLLYLHAGNIAWWHTATAALWVTAASLLALLGLAILLYIAEPSRQSLGALAGLTYVTFHCVVLDAIIWIGRFPRLE